ncbi:nitrogen fixation protein FixH [Mesonia hippocampi]|uniref:Nitrogen fixation protein FixH n=1 Tax=Mesonia hippocampi TaxID=1628250 RepID=A0A840EPI9_9FLAO|nr:FixH family protein [Mesonia hippocampi]MBB4120058.1 nitrogen fixation protein FixH [Mesonia hippocampi]
MNIKVNWGTGIVIAIIGFIGFILYFVVRMSVEDKFSHDLVVEEYYKQETHFQDKLDAAQNAAYLKGSPKIEKQEKGLLITFPSAWKLDQAKGTCTMYRPDNKKLDLEVPLVVKNNQFLIPDKKIVEGSYKVQLFWEKDGRPYYYTKSIFY